MITHNNQTYKVVIITPAGRERYLSIFKKFIYRKMEEGLIDGWQLWKNTTDPNDIAYLESMANENDKVKVCVLDEPIVLSHQPSWNSLQTQDFCKFAMDDDTIYIRFDDDIVWAEEDAIERICKARIDNPDALFIWPNVINSTYPTSMHQQIGALSEEAGVVQKYNREVPNQAYLDEFNYTDPKLINHIHNTFRKRYEEKSLSAYYLPSKSLEEYQRFSINCVCWWGKDKLQIGKPEEPWVAWEEPIRRQRPNFFVGDALMVHFAYHTQIERLEREHPEHLEFYKSITN